MWLHERRRAIIKKNIIKHKKCQKKSIQGRQYNRETIKRCPLLDTRRQSLLETVKRLGLQGETRDAAQKTI
jgi:hypothetical protein